MPRPILRFSAFQEDAEVAGRPLGEHLLNTLADAGIEPDAEDGCSVTVDAAYATLTAATLAGLADTLVREGGTLFTADGTIVAVAHASTAGRWTSTGEALRLPTQEATAVHDPFELACAEKTLMLRRLAGLARGGVRIVDPERVWIGHGVALEPGAVIWPDVVLRGQTRIHGGAEIQSGCWLQDTEVCAGALIKAHTVCDGAHIGPSCSVGPMAHLRPGSVLLSEAKVGNFVETKKATLGQGAKASHLTYLGDTEVGARANIGAGTITCNYDGYGKHRTQIGEEAFIGSNTALVAPIHIGRGAIVGAGSTLAKDVPDDALAVERGALRVLEGKAPALNRRNQVRAGKRGKPDG